ncbi:hypothetical protein ED551_13750 [Muribaculaceae bacterium Isolate-013 (NCI)]|nr:hypothetical protein ED551_13750 [Muribaculaceae bacterium Isolate-013 (NCI)]
MKKETTSKKEYITAVAGKSLLSLLAALLLCPFNLFSNSFAIGSADDDPQLPQSIPVGETPLPHSIINRPVEAEDAERFQSTFPPN